MISLPYWPTPLQGSKSRLQRIGAGGRWHHANTLILWVEDVRERKRLPLSERFILIIPFSHINIILTYMLPAGNDISRVTTQTTWAEDGRRRFLDRRVIFFPRERLSENTEHRLIKRRWHTRAAQSEVCENAGNQAELGSWFERSALNHDSKPRLIARRGLPNVL